MIFVITGSMFLATVVVAAVLMRFVDRVKGG